MTANQEEKLLGSRRLARAAARAAEQAKMTQKYERNEKLAFDTMINSLQVVAITICYCLRPLFRESGCIYTMAVYCAVCDQEHAVGFVCAIEPKRVRSRCSGATASRAKRPKKLCGK